MKEYENVPRNGWARLAAPRCQPLRETYLAHVGNQPQFPEHKASGLSINRPNYHRLHVRTRGLRRGGRGGVGSLCKEPIPISIKNSISLKPKSYSAKKKKTVFWKPRAHHRLQNIPVFAQSWATWTKCMPSHPIFWRPTLILSSTLRLGLPSSIIPFLPTCTTLPTYRILLYHLSWTSLISTLLLDCLTLGHKDTTILRNVGNHLPINTVSHPRYNLSRGPSGTCIANHNPIVKTAVFLKSSVSPFNTD